MKCLNPRCDAEEIENDDNFCYKCGYRTAKGYSFINNKKNIDAITNGAVIKKEDNFSIIFGITGLTFIIFFLMCIFRGNDLFKPFFYLKRQVENYLYGYNTSIIKTGNIYNKKIINNIVDAKKFIKNDLENQSWKCNHELETLQYQNNIETKYSIPVVCFCDIPRKEVEKITNVIDKMYFLFPKMQGVLTNISITNATTNKEYIAKFQPVFQFINPNEDINFYNKVNKTQILLNSYYFLNEKIINEPINNIVGNNWYVKDATWESIIAHELGHYISFVIFLRENKLENIIFISKNNEEKVNNVLKTFSNGDFSKSIINEALDKYNTKYNKNLNINLFAVSISKYAGSKDSEGNLIADEIIAEAIHDYFLHGINCSKSSYEIVNIIKSRLDGVS